jgi:sugar phosphate isomerase/epimerase
MKLGFIANNDLPGIEADCRFAAQHGFQGLEFNYWGGFKELTEATVRDMRRILDNHGVACSTFGLWGWNHISGDQAERAESQRQLRRAIEFAQIMGAPVLITGGGQLSDDLGQNVAAFAELMRPAIDAVKQAGMQMAIYGFHGGFLRNADAFEALWRQVPDVGLKFDPANIDHAGQDYIDVLRRFGQRVAHVHIKEHLNHHGEVVSQPAAGMGDIHWGKVLAFLYEHAYQGYLTIEPHGPLWSRPPLREKMLLLTQRYIGQFLLDGA